MHWLRGVAAAAMLSLLMGCVAPNTETAVVKQLSKQQPKLSSDIVEARKKQDDRVALRAQKTPIIGYKVALGNPRAQALFALDDPVVGYLFADTLLDNHATIDRRSGKRLAVEADLLAVVKDSAINKAHTIEQVAASISHIAAFIECPDLVVLPGPTNGAAFIATNAAVRFGVVGDVIEAQATQSFLNRLAAMEVLLRDEQSRELTHAHGRELMGHPYNAVLYLLQDLRRREIPLRAGDRISLGAFGGPVPVTEAGVVSIVYQGLAERPLRASVTFR